MLNRATLKILDCMKDGRWRTIREISKCTKTPPEVVPNLLTEMCTQNYEFETREYMQGHYEHKLVLLHPSPITEDPHDEDA